MPSCPPGPCALAAAPASAGVTGARATGTAHARAGTGGVKARAGGLAECIGRRGGQSGQGGRAAAGGSGPGPPRGRVRARSSTGRDATGTRGAVRPSSPIPPREGGAPAPGADPGPPLDPSPAGARAAPAPDAGSPRSCARAPRRGRAARRCVHTEAARHAPSAWSGARAHPPPASTAARPSIPSPAIASRQSTVKTVPSEIRRDLDVRRRRRGARDGFHAHGTVSSRARDDFQNRPVRADPGKQGVRAAGGRAGALPEGAGASGPARPVIARNPMLCQKTGFNPRQPGVRVRLHRPVRRRSTRRGPRPVAWPSARYRNAQPLARAGACWGARVVVRARWREGRVSFQHRTLSARYTAFPLPGTAGRAFTVAGVSPAYRTRGLHRADSVPWAVGSSRAHRHQASRARRPGGRSRSRGPSAPAFVPASGRAALEAPGTTPKDAP